MISKSILLVGVAFIMNSCTNAQNAIENQSLTSTAFSNQVSNSNEPVVLDVRTPGEFEKGHLKNAINIDWNGDRFDSQLATLDKSKPVYIYCLSGARSKSAAAKMRSAGFERVIELAGGMIDWRANSLPEVKLKSSANGMSLKDYEVLITSDKLVLVDFYADWCAPCKKMEPYLNKIAAEMGDRVKLVRIDADEHAELCKTLKVSALPVLKLYKNNEVVWENEGYIDEAGVRKQLK